MTFISVLGSIITIPGRIVWGWILDRISFKTVYMILITSFMAISFTVYICEFLSSKWLYMLYFIITDFGLVGIMITQPKVYINTFGHQNLVLSHGLIQFFGVSFFLIYFQIDHYLILIIFLLNT